MLFPDPILEQAAIDAAMETLKRSGVLCSHCHKEITGRVNWSGNRAFDSYCWSMRFVLGLEEEGHDRRNERGNDKGSASRIQDGR